MRDVLVGALTAAISLLAGSQLCHAMTVTELYERAHAAIAKLRVYCPDGSGGTGSGFVIANRQGRAYVATNHHVAFPCGNATPSVTVIFSDNRELPGTLVGGDEKSDVAVLTVARNDVAALTFAGPPFETTRRESAIAPTVGSGVVVGAEVVAIGFPLDLDRQPTVSRGIISAMDRNLGDASEFIQIDATIDHGSSGGPLFSMSGEVIGINARAAEKNLNFAIPYTIAKAVVGDLVLTGHVSRSHLLTEGVSILNQQAGRLTHSGYPFEEGYLVTDSAYQLDARANSPPQRAPSEMRSDTDYRVVKADRRHVVGWLSDLQGPSQKPD